MKQKLLAFLAVCLLGSCTDDGALPVKQPLPPMGPIMAFWNNFNWDEGVWQ